MIKLNRIGLKLGAAGLLGVLVAGGMAVNQHASDLVVAESSGRAEAQVELRQRVLKAEIGLRDMQIGNRGVRMAKTIADGDAAVRQVETAHAAIVEHVAAAAALAQRAVMKKALEDIGSASEAYMASARAIGAKQADVLRGYTVRSDLADGFDEAFERLHAATEAKGPEVAAAFRTTELAVRALRASSWRFSATADKAHRETALKTVENAERSLASLTAMVGAGAVREVASELDVYVRSVKDGIAAMDDVDRIFLEVARPAAERAVRAMDSAVALAVEAADTARKDADAAASKAAAVGLMLAVAVVVVLLGSVAFAFFGVSRPLVGLNRALGRMAGGDLDVEIPGAARGDEVGDIARTVAVIRDNAEAKARQEAEEQARREFDERERRKADMHRLADAFESAVGEIVQAVSSASTELEASASSLTGTARRTQEVSTVVAAASEEASTNVQSVASATEELTCSVTEISRQVQDSARFAADAVSMAERTDARVAQLAETAERIGAVVEAISAIAGQTNLLALNATIEAARAGEAGRGFAVVASEVKGLSQQTAKATAEISAQIGDVQTATRESVESIRDIVAMVRRMSEIASTIASAVEEQGAATGEIARNVQQAARGACEVSSNIVEVRQGATETGSASAQVLSAARTLSEDGGRLRIEVEKFLQTVRAA